MARKAAPAAPTVIGWREYVDLSELGLDHLLAKIDSGARTSALHASRIRLFEEDGREMVEFVPPRRAGEMRRTVTAPVADRRDIKNTGGVPETRIVIRTRLTMGGRSWQIDLSLADRQKMSNPLILGRTAIRRHKLLIDCGRSFLLDRG
ncbi:ATP-dependent zinc protease [Rhodobacteraceae bacterium KN286]|uniref:ATP-dependent zinc protease n=1 Tax=Oceanomicrobium pacificus TaxID=2692916 RepID=A0A6B0TVK4_9RHOB|nr:ATP-dependent zinc protease [Oceanomicrobium pacificus]